MLMSHDDLVSYFEMRLRAILLCPNQSCDCISILRNEPSCSAIASYLAWFERRSKYEQDSIVLQWVVYRKILPGSKYYWYHVLFDGSCFDDNEDSIQTICTHLICTAGMQTVMGIGYCRMKTIRNAATSTWKAKPHQNESRRSSCRSPAAPHGILARTW